MLMKNKKKQLSVKKWNIKSFVHGCQCVWACFFFCLFVFVLLLFFVLYVFFGRYKSNQTLLQLLFCFFLWKRQCRSMLTPATFINLFNLFIIHLLTFIIKQLWQCNSVILQKHWDAWSSCHWSGHLVWTRIWMSGWMNTWISATTNRWIIALLCEFIPNATHWKYGGASGMFGTLV